MAKFAVNKNFGRFRQCWTVEADNEEDAWILAERNGHLDYQLIYNEPVDKESKGWVVNLDEKQKEKPPISEKEYWQCMKEAVEKGMKVRSWEYEKIYGLPFNNVW